MILCDSSHEECCPVIHVVHEQILEIVLTGFFPCLVHERSLGFVITEFFVLILSAWSQLLTGDKTESELRAWLLMRKTSWGSGLLRDRI